MAFGGLFLMGYLCIVALTALWKSIGTVEHTALSIAGMSFTQPLQTAAQLTTGAITGAAAGVATGGAAYLGMAAAGSTAFVQAKDAPLRQRVAYTASAMAGRIPGGGAVGEVAAAMGWLDTDSAVYEGMYAGDRSRYSWRAARLQMERDTAGMGRSTPAAPPSRGSGTNSNPPAPPPTPNTGVTTALGAAPGGRQAGALAAPNPSGSAGFTGATRMPTAPAGSSPANLLVHAGSPAPAPEGESLTQLPPTNPHAIHATAQIGSLPNTATGADWQYVGLIQTDTGFRHAFQHPAHPLTGRRELRWVESSQADAAGASPEQRRPS
jgi:hypothetical protein